MYVFLYERVGETNIFSSFVVGEPGSQIPVRSWRFYMKYSANQGCISSFVVGRTGSECGLPVAVI